MVKRVRKPRIPPGKGREWLEKVESGIPVKEISTKEYYDSRTIKKHIRAAQQEREAHQARASVLRNALERHYEDLCELAAKIEEAVVSGGEVTLNVTDPYKWKALKQHKPKAPLWNHIRQWNSLLREIETLRQNANSEIEDYIHKEAKSEIMLKYYDGVVAGTIALLKHQFGQWLMGNSGLNIDNSFKVETHDEHYSSISCGFAQMGEVQNDHIDETKNAVKYYEDEIRSWKILNHIRKLYAEDRPEIRNRIVDEVAIITLKRVLPGQCDYCPA